MTDEPGARERFAVGCIRDDAQFAVSALSTPGGLSPVVAMSLTGYLALLVYESRLALASLGGHDITFPSTTERILASARHSIKLFDDTARGVDGQRRVMREETIPAHRSVFLGKYRFSPARLLGKDLGIYPLDGELFSTTHAASYFTGIPPEIFVAGDASKAIFDAGVVFGQVFATLAGAPQSNKPLQIVEASRFPDKVWDYRSEQLYPELFNGRATIDLNATLTCHLTLLQLVCRGILFETGPTDYARMKMQYVIAYQLTSSLKKLGARQGSELSDRSRSAISAIVSTSQARVLLARPGRRLRNLLVHYLAPVDADLTALSDDLVANALQISGISLYSSELDVVVLSQLELLHDVMLDWCGWKP